MVWLPLTTVRTSSNGIETECVNSGYELLSPMAVNPLIGRYGNPRLYLLMLRFGIPRLEAVLWVLSLLSISSQSRRIPKWNSFTVFGPITLVKLAVTDQFAVLLGPPLPPV